MSSEPVELVLSALVRARFCELLAPKVPQVSSDLFLMGLLSLMDAILEIPMTEVLDNVPLDQGTKAVLSGAASPLRPLYQLMLARESGEWQDTTHLTRTMRLSESEVAEVYWQAMQWARQGEAGEKAASNPRAGMLSQRNPPPPPVLL